MSDETKTKYYVSKTAGDWIAGHRSPGAGEEVKLTAAQARSHLRNGEIYKTKTAMADAEKEHDKKVKANKVKKAAAEKAAKQIDKEETGDSEPGDPADPDASNTGDAK